MGADSFSSGLAGAGRPMVARGSGLCFPLLRLSLVGFRLPGGLGGQLRGHPADLEYGPVDVIGSTGFDGGAGGFPGVRLVMSFWFPPGSSGTDLEAQDSAAWMGGEPPLSRAHRAGSLAPVVLGAARHSL